MKQLHQPPNQIDEVIYKKNKSFFAKLIIILPLTFFLGVILSFPFEETINTFLEKNLKTQGFCPIDYEKMEFSYIMPSIKLYKPHLGSRCFGQYQGSGIRFSQVKLSFSGFSFFPIWGLKFTLSSEAKEQNINAIISSNYFSHHVSISENNFTGQFISPMIGNPGLLQGKIALNANIIIKNNLPYELDLHLKSKNFSLIEQNIMGLQIPSTNIGALSLKLSIRDGESQLFVPSFILGDQEAPLATQLKGKIKLNYSSLKTSPLDLAGDIRFSARFLEIFPILNLFLSGKTPQNGHYQIKIGGNVGSPAPKVL
jgi:type II secretion system protein N